MQYNPEQPFFFVLFQTDEEASINTRVSAAAHGLNTERQQQQRSLHSQ